MAEEEKSSEGNRPKCDFIPGGRNIATPATPCGSADRPLYNVTRKTVLGSEKKHIICDKHLSEAWKRFKEPEAKPHTPETKLSIPEDKSRNPYSLFQWVYYSDGSINCLSVVV